MILRYAAGSLGRAIRRTTLSAFVLFATPAFVDAQMTVTGRVTVGDQPVEGATVGIPSLDIETRTASDGRYNFLVRTSQVRGQTVAVVARHRRFGSQSAMVPLVGGSLVWNFDLSTPARTTAPSVTPPPAPSATIPPSNSPTPPRPTASGASRPPGERRIATSMELTRRTADSTAFEDVAGPLDLASALAGRIPGLIVTSASALGGSAPMVFRGSRSISGSAQPLVVLDGIPLDNVGFGAAAQQVGLGGFDYGTPLQDIPLESVASVTLLDPASATPLFGSRAANGVLLIATKQARPGAGFQYSVKQRFTMESPGRLPSYQNRYGQGLGGQFEFFDGAGGGINDAVDQSWGPALDGQPIAQASFFEPRRPDVRHFLPHASGVRDYFQSGRTYDASVMLSNAGDAGGFRLGVNTRDANGLTPNTNARRLGVSLGAFAQPTDRFSGRANVYATDNRAKHRPGTGYDEINPVAGFTRFGRQVDLAALRANIKDTAEQINWIYTARNNPFFQAFENANDDTRTHVIAGGALKYDLTQRLSAAVRLGIDDVEEDRNLNVANGWKGGFPTALGRADFSGGGTQKRTLASTEQTADVSLTATSLRSGGFDLGATAGFEARKSEFRATTAIADATAPGGGGPIVPGSDQQAGKGSVTSNYLVGTASRANYFMVNAGARLERSSAFPKSLGSALFPSISVTYDAAQTVTGLRERFGTARLRASWWRSGNEVTRRTLSQTFVAAATPTPRLGIPFGEGMLPERTTGIEFGTEIASTGRRAGVDLTYYSERSSELLLTLGASGSDVFTSQLGEISNQGFEVQLHTIPFRGALGSSWELTVSLARNTNKIEKLAEGLDEVPLSPSIWGASMVARKGSPLGTIAGRRYLRDAATQALILRNGLPIPDDSGPLSILGSWRPDWTASVASKLRYRGAEFALLFDARRGGKIFSATNLWGSYAGTLESTVAERESGKLIPGIDSITGAANATAVSVEDYFHALGAIHEAWVYDASYAKLREARLSYETSLTYIPGLRRQTLRLSLIGRNLLMWAKAPNIDPETALSTGVFQGFEMGQLPSARSMGLQLSITP